MLKTQNNLYLLLAATIGLFLIYLKFAKQAPIRLIRTNSDESSASASSITLQETTNTKNGWKLLGEKGEFFKNKNLIVAHNASCSLLSQNNSKANLHSIKAEIDTNTKNLTLRGEVDGNFEEINFRGSNFFYDFSKQIASSNNQALITNPSFITESQGLEIDVKNKKVTLRGKIKSRILGTKK